MARPHFENVSDTGLVGRLKGQPFITLGVSQGDLNEFVESPPLLDGVIAHLSFFR